MSRRNGIFQYLCDFIPECKPQYLLMTELLAYNIQAIQRQRDHASPRHKQPLRSSTDPLKVSPPLAPLSKNIPKNEATSPYSRNKYHSQNTLRTLKDPSFTEIWSQLITQLTEDWDSE